MFKKDPATLAEIMKSDLMKYPAFSTFINNNTGNSKPCSGIQGTLQFVAMTSAAYPPKVSSWTKFTESCLKNLGITPSAIHG